MKFESVRWTALEELLPGERGEIIISFDRPRIEYDLTTEPRLQFFVDGELIFDDMISIDQQSCPSS